MSSSRNQNNKCSSMWIHCNRCFENYVEKQRTIYILSCYDVACEKCLIIGGKGNKLEIKCLICKNTVKGFPIGNDLPPNLKDLFHPRPWTLKFEKTSSVLKFQTKQRVHFQNGCNKMRAFVKSIANDRNQLKDQCKKLYFLQQRKKKEKSKLMSGLKRLKEIIMSRKRRSRGIKKRRRPSNDFSFDMHEISKRRDHTIPLTCHIMSRSRNDDTINFMDEHESLSTSFYL